mmetsp:Transcript_796/g.855  ORF Transcript_796/g.855 Transcript_796/m.855 type:complete len:86 (+) Transcript_796:849-1106(+)
MHSTDRDATKRNKRIKKMTTITTTGSTPPEATIMTEEQQQRRRRRRRLQQKTTVNILSFPYEFLEKERIDSRNDSQFRMITTTTT